MHTAVRDIFWAKTWSRRAITGHDSTVQAYSVVERVHIPSSVPHIRDLAYTVPDTAPRHFILQLSAEIQSKIGLYRAGISIFLNGDFCTSILKTNSIFGEQEKVAYGVARFSGPSCSRLQPFFGQLGLPDGFAYYMEG